MNDTLEIERLEREIRMLKSRIKKLTEYLAVLEKRLEAIGNKP